MSRTFVWTVAAVVTATAFGFGVSAAQIKRLGGFGGGGLPSPTRPEKNPENDAQVKQLIEDLGSKDYRTREKAGRELEELGERALPAMRVALLATDSPEVQRRLSVLVRKMDIARLIAPKLITLDVKQKTVEQTIELIAKQTGYKIDFSGSDDKAKFDFQFDKTPFWIAIDKVATTGGCNVVPDYEDERVRVYRQNSSNPYICYSGPFRIMATNINTNKSVQLSGINGDNTNRYEYMNLSFQIQSEPKNPMLGVTQAEVISAVDENGLSLVNDENNRGRSYYENRSMRGFNTYGNLNLNRSGAGASAKTIKSLKARIGIILLSGTSPEIVIDKPLEVKGKTFVGRTVQVDFGKLTEDPNTKGQYQLEATVRKHAPTEADRHDYNWSNTVWRKFDLVDADGNVYAVNYPNTLNNNGMSVQMTLPFLTTDPRSGDKLKLGPPVKLVVQEWMSVNHEIEFEFKDIPLP